MPAAALPRAARAGLVAIATLLACAHAAAQALDVPPSGPVPPHRAGPAAVEPPVPASSAPSFAPDAVRVGLVDSGVDYTLPLVRDALARHVGGPADGTILGIDFRDLDHRPFDAQALPGGRVRIVTARGWPPRCWPRLPASRSCRTATRARTCA